MHVTKIIPVVAFAASALAVGAAHAGNVTLTGFAWGSQQVTAKNVSPGSPTFGASTVNAGAFTGSTSGFADGFNGALITYCVEYVETFSFSSMSGYEVVAGDDYVHWGGNASAIAWRVGSLMTYLGTLADPVDTAFESAAAQLAIWEIIYEKPVDQYLSLADGNFLESKSGNDSLREKADAYLAGSEGGDNAFDVYVLTKDTSQDFLLLRDRLPPSEVPLPGSLALLAGGLGAMGLATRRRRGTGA